MRVTTRTLRNLPVGAQGLGCSGVRDRTDEPESGDPVATIHRALELGVNLLDTANVYGDGRSEEIIGGAISGRRDEVVVATKFGIQKQGNTRIPRGDPDYVRQCCEESLRRLHVDHIDLYYQHRVDPTVPIEDTWGAMSELVTAGKVLTLGISEASAATIRRAHAVHPITAVECEWSLWTRVIEPDVLPTCRELGIGIVAYAPLGRGFFTGEVVSRSQLSVGDSRLASPRFFDQNLAHNLELIERIKALAAIHDATPGQLALAWVHHRGRDVVPIPGTTRLRHLEENVVAANIELSMVELETLERAVPADAVMG